MNIKLTPLSHPKYTITKAKAITTPEEWGNFLKSPVTTQKQTAPHTLISIKMQQKKPCKLLHLQDLVVHYLTYNFTVEIENQYQSY